MLAANVEDFLCTKDTRYPGFSDVYDPGDNPTPRIDCACDNCFHGNDQLALEILRLRKELIEIIQHLRNINQGSIAYLLKVLFADQKFWSGQKLEQIKGEITNLIQDIEAGTPNHDS